MNIAYARSVVVEKAIARVQNELGEFVYVRITARSAEQVRLRGRENEHEINSDIALKADEASGKPRGGILTKSQLMREIGVVDSPVLEFLEILKWARIAAHADPD